MPPRKGRTTEMDDAARLVFGANVLRRRQQLGLTQDELAKASGVSRPTISEIEGGEHTNVTLRTAQRLARALQTSLPSLLPD